MKIDINKKYTFRNGEPARILCTDALRSEPVVSIDKRGDLRTHTSDGSYYGDGDESPRDLIEAKPEPREWDTWVSPNGKVIGLPHEGWVPIRVREIMPEEVPEPAIPEGFPTVPETPITDPEEIARIKSATVDKDPTPPVRGFFIHGRGTESSRDGYLTNKGTWTHGCTASDNGNFWPTKEEAEAFLAKMRSRIVEPTSSYPPPESEWRELGPYDGVFLSDDEVSAKLNGPDEGWLTADRVAIAGSRISDFPSLRARRRVSAEEAKAKAALDDGWLGPVWGPIKGLNPHGEDWTHQDDDLLVWSMSVGMFKDDYIGETVGQLFAIRAGSELARLNGLEPEKTDPYEALKEAEAGLEVAIGIISKELPGWDWQKSSPRLALKIVKKALAEKGGER